MSTASNPRCECATCGGVRPIHEMVNIIDPDSEMDAWHCRTCIADGRAGTGVESVDAWICSVLDGTFAAEQERPRGPAIGARVQVLGDGVGRIVGHADRAHTWTIELDEPSTYPTDYGRRFITRTAGEFNVISTEQGESRT